MKVSPDLKMTDITASISPDLAHRETQMDHLDVKSDSEYESDVQIESSHKESSLKNSKLLDRPELDDDFANSSDEEESVFVTRKKQQDDRFKNDNESELEDNDDTVGDSENSIPKSKLDESEAMVLEHKKRVGKLKKMTPEQLAKEEKKIKRTGVCYLSSIPPYMKPVKLRSILSRFGKLDRIFLKPEDQASYRKRVKYGGNKKKKFTEGWVEFVRKKDAKMCAQTMNGNIIGGKKSSYYHDDIMNIRYLLGLKWADLTQQIAKENEERQAKMMLEISQQAKLDKTFVGNVEKAKRIDRKRKAEGDAFEQLLAKKSFDQRDVTSTRADSKAKKENTSGNLQDVLSKVF